MKETKWAAEVDQVVAHWKQKRGGDIRSKKTIRQITERFREGYTVEDITRSIDALLASQWHRDNNQLRIDLVVRDGERIDKWLAEATPPPDESRLPTIPQSKPWTKVCNRIGVEMRFSTFVDDEADALAKMGFDTEEKVREAITAHMEKYPHERHMAVVMVNRIYDDYQAKKEQQTQAKEAEQPCTTALN